MAQMEITTLIFAHVKWFAPFDVNAMPKPIGEVLNGQFVKFFLGSVAAVCVFFWADRTAYRRGLLRALDARLKRLDDLSVLILRLSVAIFLISLWVWYQATGNEKNRSRWRCIS
jgi:hypothetical protein